MTSEHHKPSDALSLDTSGQVIVNQTRIMWSDLDAFTRGYVEALLSGYTAITRTAMIKRGMDPVGYAFRFSDLAPETLATILKDCAEFEDGRRYHGECFWRQRQADSWSSFPPLTIALNSAGKVVFS